jgi:hypothetical protein
MTKAKEHIFLCDILEQYTPQISWTIKLLNLVFRTRKAVILVDRKSADQSLILLKSNACSVIVKMIVNESVTPPPRKKSVFGLLWCGYRWFYFKWYASNILILICVPRKWIFRKPNYFLPIKNWELLNQIIYKNQETMKFRIFHMGRTGKHCTL